MQSNKNNTKTNNLLTIEKEPNPSKNVMKWLKMETESLANGKINNYMEKFRFSIKMVTFSSNFWINLRGRYEHGIRINGHFIFSNGYEYKGGFLGDKFRGYGELRLPSGKIICGDWTE